MPERVLGWLVVAAIALYVGVWRARPGHVDHYAPARQTAYWLICLGLAAAVGALVVWQFEDALMCASGYGDPETRRFKPGKNGVKLVCSALAGAPGAPADERDGSVTAGLAAFLALGSIVFGLTSAAWRALSPPAPPRVEVTPVWTAPTDRRDRRRARKRARRS